MSTGCYFSGSDDISAIIAEKILSATNYILLAMFTLTDRKLIESLKICRSKGMSIFAVFDTEQLSSYNHVILELINSDIVFKTIGNSHSRMHHKFVVIDGVEVVTGSFNWTGQANRGNMENIVTIQDRLVCNRFFDEFNRIWLSITSKDINEYPERERDEADELVDKLLKNIKKSVVIKRNELPLELRDLAISKAYFYRSKGEYKKALKIVDCLISINPEILAAKTLKKDILSKQ